MRTVGVAPGIGDNIWLLQKLVNCNERFNFMLPASPPRRGKQIFDLLPQVAHTADYAPGLTYRKVMRFNATRRRTEFKMIRENYFFICANPYLEEGKRIEGFLKDLPTAFQINWVTTNKDKESAEIVKQFPETRLVGIYTSAYSTQRAWGFWDEKKWFALIDAIRFHDEETAFVIIGAQWDVDLSTKLMELMQENNVTFLNTIGQPLGTVVEILKQLDYFIGFPSGLSILNETLGKDGIMFYPPHLKKLMGTWADPERIQSNAFKECLFCEPEEIFKWMLENGKV